MIELELTYQQALDLLEFLAAKNNPDLERVRNNLLMEIDNYEQICLMSIGIKNQQELLKQLPTE